MVTTELTPVTTASISARSVSAVPTGSPATSTQPGVTAIDPFGALMDQLGSNATAPTVTADPTTKVAPNMPAPVPQAMPPVQPTVQQIPMPSPPVQAAASVANTIRQPTGTKAIAATTAEADDPIVDDKPMDATLIAVSAPQLPMPILPQPQTVSPLATSAQTNDALGPADAATSEISPQTAGTTQEYSVGHPPVTTSEDGSQATALPLIAGPSDKPTDAVLTAQAAVTPSSARSTGRIHDDGPARTASTSPEADIQGTERPGLDLFGSLPVTTAFPATVPTQGTLAASPISTATAQPSPNQPASITPAQSARAAKTASEPTPALSQSKSSPAAPDIAPSNTSTIATTAAAPIEAAGLSTTPSPTFMPEPARQVSARPASTPASPASQVAQAIVEPVKILMSSASQAASTVSHITTIQIAPAELGRVDIRIERSVDGPATIQLIAERPETLSRLVHDQSQLQQALDQAGVPQAGRTLDFSLAPTTPDFAASSPFAGDAANGGSSSNNGQQRRAGTYANQAFGTADDTAAIAMPPLRSIRTGIDITA